MKGEMTKALSNHSEIPNGSEQPDDFRAREVFKKIYGEHSLYAVNPDWRGFIRGWQAAKRDALTQSRAALSAQEQVEPTDAEIIKAIANCRHTITDEYVMLYRDPQQDGNALDQFVRRALLSANQGK